jgi:hypothetical protein
LNLDVRKLSLSKRYYSTNTVDKILPEVDNIDINESIKFDSLDSLSLEDYINYFVVIDN